MCITYDQFLDIYSTQLLHGYNLVTQIITAQLSAVASWIYILQYRMTVWIAVVHAVTTCRIQLLHAYLQCTVSGYRSARHDHCIDDDAFSMKFAKVTSLCDRPPTSWVLRVIWTYSKQETLLLRQLFVMGISLCWQYTTVVIFSGGVWCRKYTVDPSEIGRFSKN